MPDAFDNYFMYTLESNRVPNLSPALTVPSLSPAQSVPSLSPAGPGEQRNCFTYNYDHRTMSTAGSYSPSSMESPLLEEDLLENTPLQQRVLNMLISDNSEINEFEKSEIKILVQPVDKFRFRYKSEMMGTHGSLLGEREESTHKKEVPTVQLINPGILKNAVIRCTLVTSEEDRRFPHAHHLVRKSDNGTGDNDDPHDIEVSDDNNYTAMFCNMGIIHTAKKNIKEEIVRKRKIEVLEEKKRKNFKNASISTREDLEMKMEAEKAQKWMNLNSVALCFQGFSYGRNNVLIPITDKVYSRPINNLKSALTGELKICRIDKHCGSCEGHEEVFLLVEKVGKKNIRVKFYQVDDDDNVTWDADGRFTELDVHHQYAIVFKTPPFKDTNITKPVEVLIKLERPSDGEISNSVKFVYKPSDKVLNRKRPRMSTSESMEAVQTAPYSDLGNCMPMAETMMSFTSPMTPISNLSGEIKKLLAEDPQYNNDENLKKFFADNSSIENFLALSEPLAESSPIQLLGGYQFDACGTVESRSGIDFAKDILQKVMSIFKETESNVGARGETLNKVKGLLEELTHFGDTPLHFSLRNEQYDHVKYILMILGSDPIFRSTVNMQNSSGKTPLHLAVIQNQPEVVRALLKLGADPNLCDEEDATSLHNAVTVEACACIDELLKSNKKLNLEAHTESGHSALHLAAKNGSLYAVKALLDAGADVNSTDMSYGRTALHFAVDSNHTHIVNYLLTKTKVDVNMKNFGGNTALHGAVAKGGKCAEELVKILKKHGADPKIRNNNANQDEEEEEDNSVVPPTATEMATDMAIKSENSDSDDESTPGESSFDLAKNDPKLMQLLRDEPPPNSMQEELDLKEESEDEMTLQDRLVIQVRNTASQQRHSAPTPMTTPMTKPTTNVPQKHVVRPDDVKLTDEHVNRVKPILDRTGGWERLANHTNHGSLVRLYRKTSSPSSALFVKIRLQNPDVTVRQVKKWLIDVEAFEAASALEPR